MAKVKLTLTPSPTFKTDVAIPVPGEGVSIVKFTFKGRTRSEFQEWAAKLAGMSDVDAVMSCASGWDLEYPFDSDNIEQIVESYMGASQAILDKYVSELMPAKRGN